MIAAPRRVLAVPRATQQRPPDADELFGSLYANVANDGAPHPLLDTTVGTGIPQFIDSTRVSVIRWVRVEWQQLDATIPPPLSLEVLVNGTPSNIFAGLGRLFFQAIADGTPAFEQSLNAILPPMFVAPGRFPITVNVTNTGVVNPQGVAMYFWGWSYPPTLIEGAR